MAKERLPESFQEVVRAARLQYEKGAIGVKSFALEVWMELGRPNDPTAEHIKHLRDAIDRCIMGVGAPSRLAGPGKYRGRQRWAHTPASTKVYKQ
jgi:hypothetical protein